MATLSLFFLSQNVAKIQGAYNTQGAEGCNTQYVVSKRRNGLKWPEIM